MVKENIKTLLAYWDVVFFRIVPQAFCFGSPERSLYRMVIEDQRGEFFILEQIAQSNVLRKERIAIYLHQLKKQNPHFKIVPYKKNIHGKDVSFVEGKHWMLTPYLKTQPLPRPDYLSDSWRGHAMANFLLELKQCSAGLVSLDKEGDIPPLDEYIFKLMKSIQDYHPEVYQQLIPALNHLKNSLFPLLSGVETTFCHGDFHPLNILWGKQTIRSVIDWEFTGFKPYLYDVANMLGCLGMEHPNALLYPISLEFIGQLRKNGFANKQSWSSLIDLVLALRFAWLSEWFRKNDLEMIELEVDYIQLLLDQRFHLIKQWQIDTFK